MKAREWWIAEQRFYPYEAHDEPGPGRYHVREVLPDTVTITREELTLAMQTIWQGDEKFFGAKPFAGELWNELVTLFGEQRLAPNAKGDE